MLVILKATTDCNLRCTYCSADAGTGKRKDLCDEDCERLVHELPDILSHEECVTWLWHGGEPTLIAPEKFSRMQTILSSLKDHPQKVQIQTNALSISSEWVNVLKKHNVSVGVSIDGAADIHDNARKTATGSGSHESAMRNVKLMRAAEMPVSILCTVANQHTSREAEIVEWLENLDLPVRFNPLNKLGRAKDAISGKDYFTFLRNIFIRALEKRLSISIQPLEWMLASIIYDQPSGECSYSGECGKHYFSYGPEGEVSACGRLAESFGNIYDDRLKNIWLSSRWNKLRQRSLLLQEGKCGKCGIWKWCHGGCPANADVFPADNECVARKDFYAWLQNDGLRIYKNALIDRRKVIRAKLELIAQEKAFLSEKLPDNNHVRPFAC